MRRVGLILLLALIVTGSLLAQKEKGEKVEAYKIAYITEQLDLSPTEAENFWPIYNQYKKESKALKSKVKKDIDLLSDNDLEAYIESVFVSKEQQLVLERKLYKDLKPVISIRKIAKLGKVEKGFKRALLKRMRERRKGRKNR